MSYRTLETCQGWAGAMHRALRGFASDELARLRRWQGDLSLKSKLLFLASLNDDVMAAVLAKSGNLLKSDKYSWS